MNIMRTHQPTKIHENFSLGKNMSSSVHVEEVVLVTASKPTPSHNLRLSALDSQIFLRFTIEYLLVYRPIIRQQQVFDDDRAAVTARVKAALARALVPYYPFSGRVKVRSDGSGLEVVCRNQGALFIEATSDYTSGDLVDPPKYCEQWWKFLSLHVVDVLNGAPPLVMQLTWLSDGGATLAVGFSHCLCDGIGSADFLNFFASLATGKPESASPVWERQLVDPTPAAAVGVGNIRNHHPEFKKVTDTCGFLSRFSKERLVPTSVTFDEKRLNELKKSAAMPASDHCSSPTTTPTTTTYSSFEVLAAHVWRSWAKSLNFPSKQILKLLFSVNIRNRVKPSLPSGYYGNAFVLGCAQTTVKELAEKGLRETAEMIKRAKERVEDEYVREVAESVSWERGGGGSCPDTVGVLIMSQWSRLGLDKVDLGMGRPVHVGPVVSDRYCLLLPVCDRKEGVKVNLAVPASTVDQYLYLIRNTNNK